MGAVYRLALRQLTGRTHLVFMSVLIAAPIAMAVMMVQSDDAPSVREFETIVLAGTLAGSILPLVALAIASSAFSTEVENRTLANLTLTPIPRWQIVLPKLLAAITIGGTFVALSAFATSYAAFLGDPKAVVAVTVAAVVGFAMYSAAFLWLGLVSTQAIGVGLLYIVLWEGLFGGFVAGVRSLSIRYHAIALMHGLDERRFAWSDHVSLTVAIIASVVVIAGFVFLSIRRLRRMDVP